MTRVVKFFAISWFGLGLVVIFGLVVRLTFGFAISFPPMSLPSVLIAGVLLGPLLYIWADGYEPSEEEREGEGHNGQRSETTVGSEESKAPQAFLKCLCICGANLKVDEKLVGKKGKCPKCGEIVEIVARHKEESTTPPEHNKRDTVFEEPIPSGVSSGMESNRKRDSEDKGRPLLIVAGVLDLLFALVIGPAFGIAGLRGPVRNIVSASDAS